ncbi:carboxylesterase family protein [Solihabitans fulvus]|uniref:Carboxylic ester hydrolase n=1 Tax=Solihabitans fulvus TaxID=1892852 RepID=A0A5B2X6U5_9PSEU|nr:carboxylesterase family protein [Solihabitans fulvus]KAA2258819.1 carboxylesterase family protein [Solihabitans fulvus]
MVDNWLLKLTAALAVVVGTAAAPAAAASDDTTVHTAGGWVRGTVASDHRSFQGMPYAAAPTGALRWRAPQPAAPWPGVRDATRPGQACPQYYSAGQGQPPTLHGDEDCLSVNVTTPRGPTGPLPVLVFVHGGGFVGGSGALYDPTRMVTRGGVVVVTLNYRLGALGFLDHPALDHPAMGDGDAGNYGLADQQAALRWVRRNIAAFGGDAANVTLWGESAGAFSTCAQLAAPGARGLFDKAIVQSGPCGNSFATRQTAEQRGRDTASGLGCVDQATVADCLRGKPVGELASLGNDQVFLAHRDIADLPWLPVAGTPALPLQPPTALRLGLAARVPLILGGTRDEMRAFVAASYDGRRQPVTATQYPEIIRTMFGPSAAEAILARYPADRYPTPSLALATLLGDYGGMLGACTQLPAADAAARRAPVYSYEFAEPDGQGLPGFPFGATHGDDVRYFFDSTYSGWTPPPLTEAQQALAGTLIDEWTAFARTGAPGWPAYRPGGVTLSLSAGGTGPIDLAGEHDCGFWLSRTPR